MKLSTKILIGGAAVAVAGAATYMIVKKAREKKEAEEAAKKAIEEPKVETVNKEIVVEEAKEEEVVEEEVVEEVETIEEETVETEEVNEEETVEENDEEEAIEETEEDDAEEFKKHVEETLHKCFAELKEMMANRNNNTEESETKEESNKVSNNTEVKEEQVEVVNETEKENVVVVEIQNKDKEVKYIDFKKSVQSTMKLLKQSNRKTGSYKNKLYKNAIRNIKAPIQTIDGKLEDAVVILANYVNDLAKAISEYNVTDINQNHSESKVNRLLDVVRPLIKNIQSEITNLINIDKQTTTEEENKEVKAQEITPEVQPVTDEVITKEFKEMDEDISNTIEYNEKPEVVKKEKELSDIKDRYMKAYNKKRERKNSKRRRR